MLLNVPNTVFDGGIATVLSLMIIGLYIFWQWQEAQGTIKGPWGVPILGYVPFMTNEPYKDFFKLSKKYGDIFSIRLGSKTLCIINGYETIKECLVKGGDIFTRRPTEGLEYEFGDGISTLVTNGNVWKEQRRFLLSSMRDFGFGTSKMEKNAQEEAKAAVKELSDNCGIPVDFSQLLSSMSYNMMALLLFGRRFSYDDKEVIAVVDEFHKFTSGSVFYSPVILFPGLLKLIPKSLIKAFQQVMDMKRIFYLFVDKMKEEHEKTFDENSMNDVLDLYVQKQRELQRIGQNINDTVYSDKHLRANALLLFTGGTDTTSSTICWALKLLAAHPDTQKQLQKEVDGVIGRARPPSMNDRLQMPYMESFLLEVHRYITILPILLVRMTREEFSVGDVRIPKAMPFMVNMWSIHNDKRVWDKPEEFNPSRFLEPDKTISQQLRAQVVPFGTGKRNCLGEPLARMEIFIFLTSFLQHFTFHSPTDEPLTFESSLMLTNKLESCTLKVTPRD